MVIVFNFQWKYLETYDRGIPLCKQVELWDVISVIGTYVSIKVNLFSNNKLCAIFIIIGKQKRVMYPSAFKLSFRGGAHLITYGKQNWYRGEMSSSKGFNAHLVILLNVFVWTAILNYTSVYHSDPTTCCHTLVQCLAISVETVSI